MTPAAVRRRLTVLRSALAKRRANGHAGSGVSGGGGGDGGGDFTLRCVAELQAIGAELRRHIFDRPRVVREALDELADPVTGADIEARVRDVVARAYGRDLATRRWPTYGDVPGLVLAWMCLTAKTIQARRAMDEREAEYQRRMAEAGAESPAGSDRAIDAKNREWVRQRDERDRDPGPLPPWNALTEEQRAWANEMHREFGTSGYMHAGFREFWARRAEGRTTDADVLFYVVGFPGEREGRAGGNG
jgi:hypothetical protein